jgi:hypothetical protein
VIATSNTTIITDNSAPVYLTQPSTLRRAGTPTPWLARSTDERSYNPALKPDGLGIGDSPRAQVPDTTDTAERQGAQSFRELAAGLDVSAVALALGWLHTLDCKMVTLPGARTQQQCNANLSAQQRPLAAAEKRAVDLWLAERRQSLTNLHASDK